MSLIKMGRCFGWGFSFLLSANLTQSITKTLIKKLKLKSGTTPGGQFINHAQQYEDGLF
jgi:hypothetical protein